MALASVTMKKLNIFRFTIIYIDKKKYIYIIFTYQHHENELLGLIEGILKFPVQW